MEVIHLLLVKGDNMVRASAMSDAVSANYYADDFRSGDLGVAVVSVEVEFQYNSREERNK